MSLDAVNYVFDRLAAAYGAAWDQSMGQAPIGDVKTVWADCLGSFLHSENAKKSIMWALKNLPDRVPNAMAFRNLCRLAPAEKVVALPSPKADPVRMAVELAKLGTLRSSQATPTGAKDWAHKLKARHQAGDNLNSNQIKSYQIALRGAA